MSEIKTPWLTFPQVCDELGVSRGTLNAWRRDGRFPAFKRLPNGSLRLRRADLEAWSECLVSV